MSRLPAPEPGVFTGDPLHYPSWKKAFDTFISTRAIPDEERLNYLKKYLGGDASKVISYWLHQMHTRMRVSYFILGLATLIRWQKRFAIN